MINFFNLLGGNERLGTIAIGFTVSNKINKIGVWHLLKILFCNEENHYVLEFLKYTKQT